ncbi:MAG: hypothetical protein MI746_07235, partial [Pseudomonadales bacterium]|nr:hypothetical protein [Pseudomonadales bacterium]
TRLAAGMIYLSLFSSLGAAQTDWQMPRLANGKPDLQGAWTNGTISTLERNDSYGEKLVFTEEEALQYEQSAGLNRYALGDARPSDPGRGAPAAGRDPGAYNAFWLEPGTRTMRIAGEGRTSFIVEPTDGKIPYSDIGLQAWERYNAEAGTDGPEQRPLEERCIVGYGSTGGPPMLPVVYGNYYQIVQTDDYIVIRVEMNNDARIIRLNSEHHGFEMQPWLGDSVGYWDEDTLVVQTTNFHPQQSFRVATQHRIYIPSDAMVTERFTRIGPDEILYDFTVTHDEVFTQPWRAQISMRSADDPPFEFGCHEGNYALTGVLAGARREEVDAELAEQ